MGQPLVTERESPIPRGETLDQIFQNRQARRKPFNKCISLVQFDMFMDSYKSECA